jgi:hypothetical protein
MYLSLKALFEFSRDGGNAADILNEALDPPTPVGDLAEPLRGDPLASALYSLARARMVTLDLEGTGDLISEQDAEALASVVKHHWGPHGFCLTRCPDIGLWTRAANRQGQPLLLWHQFSPHAGWHVLGPELRARELDIYRALCLVNEASGDDLAHNPAIVSQHPRPDAHTTSHLARTGQMPPDGPSASDVSNVERILRRLVERRYVLELGPRRYCVVHPTPPRR